MNSDSTVRQTRPPVPFWPMQKLASVLCLLLLVPMVVRSQELSRTDPGAALIDINLAQYVATEHVHLTNRPYQWHVLDHMILYGVDGKPNAYAFVFGEDGSRFTDASDLRQHIVDYATTKEGRPANDDDLYAFSSIATVITGATEDSPLILRHFRGVPGFWVQAVTSILSGGDESRAAGSVLPPIVMVTPMDFRLIKTRAKAPAPLGTKQAKAPFLVSDEVVSTRSARVGSIGALQQRAQERATKNQEQLERLTLEQRQQHEDAVRDRRAFLRRQWETKRSAWDNAASGERQQQ